jgi:hypothetical protein
MAFDRIIAYPSATDLGLYATLRSKTDGKVFNGTATETWLDAHIGTYDVALTFLGGGAYGFTVPAALPHDDYTAFFHRPAVIGTPAVGDTKLPDEWEFRWTGHAGDIVPVGAWRYSDRAHVLALVGDLNAVPIWDLNGDGTEDPGLMEQDGVQADTYIDRFLAANGVTVPIDTTTASAVLVQSLADIGAHLTVWYGFHHRGLEEMGGRMDRSANDIAGLMSGYKDYADAELAKLLTIIETENGGADEEIVPAMQAVVPVREQACGYPWGWG